MAQSKLDKQQKALERLTAIIGDNMASLRETTPAQRKEYNRLKVILAKAGRTHEGRI